MRDKTVTSLFALRDMLLAGILLTRLPLPTLTPEAFGRSAHASWAYPIVGLGLGGLVWALWGILSAFGVSDVITAGLCVSALVLMTGALHEDGLADTADGLWGGMDAARRLDIMKDSRIGTYGVLALILSIGLRWSALISTGPVALIASATLSRAVLPAMMRYAPFARPNGLARSVGRPPQPSAIAALGLGALAVWVFLGFAAALGLLMLAILLATAMAFLAKHKIGGITGDILGATQQIVEIAVLIALVT